MPVIKIVTNTMTNSNVRALIINFIWAWSTNSSQTEKCTRTSFLFLRRQITFLFLQISPKEFVIGHLSQQHVLKKPEDLPEFQLHLILVKPCYCILVWQLYPLCGFALVLLGFDVGLTSFCSKWRCVSICSYRDLVRVESASLIR